MPQAELPANLDGVTYHLTTPSLGLRCQGSNQMRSYLTLTCHYPRLWSARRGDPRARHRTCPNAHLALAASYARQPAAMARWPRLHSRTSCHHGELIAFVRVPIAVMTNWPHSFARQSPPWRPGRIRSRASRRHGKLATILTALPHPRVGLLALLTPGSGHNQRYGRRRGSNPYVEPNTGRRATRPQPAWRFTSLTFSHTTQVITGLALVIR